jgi:hypothetical protein
MYRNFLIGGVTAAAIVGAGGTAIALTGSDTTAGAPAAAAASSSTPSTADRQKRLARKGKLLKRMQHAQITTRGKDGFVTHDLINGTVTAVSSTSITVQAADKKSETFVVTKDTKVRLRTGGKGSASSIDKVLKGDHVVVAGTGTTTFTAKHVVDVKKK